MSFFNLIISGSSSENIDAGREEALLQSDVEDEDPFLQDPFGPEAWNVVPADARVNLTDDEDWEDVIPTAATKEDDWEKSVPAVSIPLDNPSANYTGFVSRDRAKMGREYPKRSKSQAKKGGGNGNPRKNRNGKVMNPTIKKGKHLQKCRLCVAAGLKDLLRHRADECWVRNVLRTPDGKPLCVACKEKHLWRDCPNKDERK